MIRSYYRVAEHLFAVESSNSALFDLMTNYQPFAENYTTPHYTTLHNTTPIFTLRVEVDKPIRQDGEEWTHVLTDNAEEDMPRIEVYHSPQPYTTLNNPIPHTWLFRVAMVANAPICCEMECSEDFTEGVLHILPDCQDVRFCVDNALMLLFAFRTAPLMTLEMHAAVVVKEGRGYLFLGHSGTGKSTHARQWLAAFDDAWLLNDDNPIIRVMEDGEVRVYGSPWSGKTPCYNNAHARVGGIVKLSQAPHNKIQTISLPEAYAYMLSSASGLKMDRKMADSMYESIKHVITHVKCYHLNCLPNTEAAEVAQRGMV
jgi:hypothetical protein